MTEPVTKRTLGIDLMISLGVMLVTGGIAWGVLSSAQAKTEEEVKEVKNDVKEVKHEQKDIRESIHRIEIEQTKTNSALKAQTKLLEKMSKRLEDWNERDRSDGR